jgi:hypothetical protein
MDWFTGNFPKGVGRQSFPSPGQFHARIGEAIELIDLRTTRARVELGVPDGYRMEAAAVVGRRDVPDRLPEGLRERELPSARKPVSEVAFVGAFPGAWLPGDLRSA